MHQKRIRSGHESGHPFHWLALDELYSSLELSSAHELLQSVFISAIPDQGNQDLIVALQLASR